MGTPAVGVAAKMAFDTALPFDTSSIPMEFESCSVKKTGRIIATDGMRGTRQLIKERWINGCRSFSERPGRVSSFRRRWSPAR